MAEETRAGTAQAETGPSISVVMSNFNGSAYLEAAITSVLTQSHSALELIVVDDASTDDSRKILDDLAAQDDRLKPIALDENQGPAGARNIAIDAAGGDWVAIVDADDLIHPQRIARLLALAEKTCADVIADDLLSFGSVDFAGRTLLDADQARKAHDLTLAELVRSDTVVAGLASLGYLKPMIRKEILGALRYDQTLRIGEDFDLYSRLLLRGARFVISPDPTYLYRRHVGSVSHRLSAPSLRGLIAAHEALAEQAARRLPEHKELLTQLRLREQRLGRALRYQRLVDGVKANGIPAALSSLWQHPDLLRDVFVSLKDRLRRGVTFARSKPSSQAKTVVLATLDGLPHVAAPPNSIRVPVVAAPSADAESWSKRRAMACRLAKLASNGPIDVIAEGPEGLDALGYVPERRSTRLALEQQDRDTAQIPRDVVLDPT